MVSVQVAAGAARQRAVGCGGGEAQRLMIARAICAGSMLPVRSKSAMFASQRRCSVSSRGANAGG